MSPLCKYDLRKDCDIRLSSLFELGKGVTNEADKYLLRTANVLLLPLVARCLETIDMCI